MLHLKYAPKILSECAANLNVIKELSNYLKNNIKNTVCLIHGNTGSGKTLTTNLILKDLKMHKTELNFTDKINKVVLQEKIDKTQNSVLVFEDAQFYENELMYALNCFFKSKTSFKKIIIISDSEFPTSSFVNIVSIQTKITNKKLYCNFIKNILKKENINKSFILKYICNFSNKIRSCISNLDNEQTSHGYLHDNSECIKTLSTSITVNEKIKILQNNYINIQHIYYENIIYYDIDIKTRLQFSKSMVLCDFYNTIGYNNQNWEMLNYIPYVSCIYSSNILPEPPKTLSKSTIWSSYSNLCSKINKTNLLFKNEYFLYNYKIIKFIQTEIKKNLKNNNVNEIKTICLNYNINEYETLLDIINIGNVKKQIIKNIKLIKSINK